MDGGGDAGDDGDVVGVRDGGHGALGGGVETGVYEGFHVGEDFVLEAAGEVGGVEAVDAYDDGGGAGEVVGAVVEGD